MNQYSGIRFVLLGMEKSAVGANARRIAHLMSSMGSATSSPLQHTQLSQLGFSGLPYQTLQRSVGGMSHRDTAKQVSSILGQTNPTNPAIANAIREIGSPSGMSTVGRIIGQGTPLTPRPVVPRLGYTPTDVAARDLQSRLSSWTTQRDNATALSGRHGVDRRLYSPQELGSLSQNIPAGAAYRGHVGQYGISGTPFSPGVEPGSAMFVSGQPAVAARYAGVPATPRHIPEGTPGYLSVYRTPELASHGPSSPGFHPHIGEDTRGWTPRQVTSALTRLRRQVPLGHLPDYERVFTAPVSTFGATQQSFKKLPGGQFMRVYGGKSTPPPTMLPTSPPKTPATIDELISGSSLLRGLLR